MSSSAATASRSRCRASASPAAIRTLSRLRDARTASRNVALDPGWRHPQQWPRARSGDPRGRRPGSTRRPSRPRPGPAMPLAGGQGPVSGRTTRPRPRPTPDRPAMPGVGGPATAAGQPRRPRPERPRVTTTTTRWHRCSPPLIPRQTAAMFPTARAPRPPILSCRDLAIRSLCSPGPVAPDASMTESGLRAPRSLLASPDGTATG